MGLYFVSKYFLELVLLCTRPFCTSCRSFYITLYMNCNTLKSHNAAVLSNLICFLFYDKFYPFLISYLDHESQSVRCKRFIINI